MRRRKRHSVEEYLAGIRAGERNMLAQAITLVESNLPEDQELSGQVLQACLPFTGNTIRLGITGVPGVGKSTFIDVLGQHLLKESLKPAILAIDPSSKISKGSILGDKTRMERLSREKDAFIRPSAAGEALGGVTIRTRETMLLCEAAGFDVIIVETVGVGQSETAVRDMTDFFLLLMLPGAGDELQGIKRGIMEMADAIAINKSDGSNISKARIAKSNYSQALRMFPDPKTGWHPEVLMCSSVEERGIGEVWELVVKHRKMLDQKQALENLRLRQRIKWFDDALNELLRKQLRADERMQDMLEASRKSVEENLLPPSVAAAGIIRKLF